MTSRSLRKERIVLAIAFVLSFGIQVLVAWKWYLIVSALKLVDLSTFFGIVEFPGFRAAANKWWAIPGLTLLLVIDGLFFLYFAIRISWFLDISRMRKALTYVACLFSTQIAGLIALLNPFLVVIPGPVLGVVPRLFAFLYLLKEVNAEIRWLQSKESSE